MIENLYSIYLSCSGRVTTDSRAVVGGELFFALRGEQFDGNEYALSALEKGAAYAVVNDDVDFPRDDRIIPVPSPLEALTKLATYHRLHVHGESRLPVIGLTGTNGKTTTKELITAVLSAKFEVCATKGNLNNDIGVPLSLLGIRESTQIAVIEMGASHPDDITKLVRVACPDYGLITNVGSAHLEGFSSFEGVKKAKGELYRYLSGVEGSLIFRNADDADLSSMSEGIITHWWEYGVGYESVSVETPTPQSPCLVLTLSDGRQVRTNLVGSYNASNVLAALAVGRYFGVDTDAAIAAIEAYVPSNKRSQLEHIGDNTLVIDAYNANPSSMKAALGHFASVAAPSKLALLGDMKELGPASLEEHISVLRQLESSGLESCLVGEEFRKALDAFPSYKKAMWFRDSVALADYLSACRPSGKVILIKGSRSMAMEKTLESLREQ